jgi:polyhydroxyalkanoate synthesis regulator phasin
MRKHLLQRRVLQAAKTWWDGKCSDVALHLKNPTMNTTSDSEIKLARAVAELVKEGWGADETRQLIQDLLNCAKGLEKGNWRTCDEVINRPEIFRRAEVFLGRRVVEDDVKPQPPRPRKFIRLQSRDGSE